MTLACNSCYCDVPVVIFLFLSFILYLLMGFSCKKEIQYSFSLLYLFNHLFQHGIMDIYFIFCISIQYNSYLLCYSNCYWFNHCRLFYFGSSILFWHASITYCLFVYLSGITGCFKFILYFYCPSPGIEHFSKEFWFLLLENDIEKTQIVMLSIIANECQLLLGTLRRHN